jgi:hypothetical protein
VGKISQDQLQSILDTYSVGRIVGTLVLTDVLVNDEKKVNISRCLAETNQGMYLVAFAPNDDLHRLWWSSDLKDFAATLFAALKLKNAKILLTNQDTTTVHKFDLRISVFAL